MTKTTYQLADISTRFFALIIDGLIISVITGALFGAGRGAGAGLGFVIDLAYYWYFWSRNNGQTPGKSLMGIKIVKTDGTPITDSDAIVRFFGYVVGGMCFALGFIWAIFDSENQGWHDKMANTYVVVVPKE